MGDGPRTIRIVSTDDSLQHATKVAIDEIGGWQVATCATVDELLESDLCSHDVILLDKWLRGANIYETLRDLSQRARARTFLVCDHTDDGDAIARFCGATGTLPRPLSARRLADAIGQISEPAAPLPSDSRGDAEAVLPEALLTDISGQTDESLVASLCDPETSLFNFSFLNYKLDEEFKRSKRFGQPLACVMLGFDSQIDPVVLSQLASIFLLASRDTDILGRFDETSFLFLLPHTGPEGARVMARRVAEEAESQGLSDLVGDPLTLSVGISSTPSPSIQRREDLFREAREAFVDARNRGGGVVATT